MSFPKLEALADGIMHFEGWAVGSRSYMNRNPGNLRLGGRVGTSEFDDKGFTIFPSLVTGYQALLNELHAKCSGNNSHGLGPDSTLLDLFKVYAPSGDNNPTEAYCTSVAQWATKALGEPVTSQTKLRAFLQ
jgi:hypothetical protein